MPLRHLKRHWDRIAGWTSIAIGAIALLVGWIGTSGTAYPAEQLPFILSGGVAGIFLLGLGAALLLIADMKDEWIKLDRVEARLERIETAVSGAPPGERAPANPNGQVPTQQVEPDVTTEFQAPAP